MDLETGQRDRLLPDFQMQRYTISADGQRVAFVAAEGAGGSPVWVAALNGRSAPLRLFGNDGLQAFFGPGGDVLFAAAEKGTNFIYRIKEDGSALQKVMRAPALLSVSPDGKWVGVYVPGSGGDMSLAVKVYPVDGGAPVLICQTCDESPSFERGPWPSPVSWSPDGKFVYLTLQKSTFAIPLRPGQSLPAIPASGFRTKQELSGLPGARLIAEQPVFPGPSPSVYAFTKVAIQRNIYKVPVP